MAKDLSITKLKSAIGSELLRPNRFDVRFAISNTLQSAITAAPNISMPPEGKASALVERAEIPGRTLATADSNRPGPQFKSVYDTTYNDITMSIIADDKLEIRALLEFWMNFIIRQPDLNNREGGITRFYNEYVGTVFLEQLNQSNEVVALYTLEEAYPVQISSMPFSAEENDTYQRYTVDFTYRYHTSEFKKL